MIQFFKSGDSMGIRASGVDRDSFLEEAAAALGEMIDGGLYDNDWEFQLAFWVPNIADLAQRIGA